MSDRNLNELEIESLVKNGCKSDNWQSIRVPEKFVAEKIINVHFSGIINLGIFEDYCEVEEGVLKPCGLYNCFLNNVSIQNNVRIANVGYVQNYTIEEGVCLESIESLAVTGETSFGNGTRIEILNEGGGRELPIFDTLSAQLAYLIVNYRYEDDLIKSLEQLIERYVTKKRNSQGTIGRNTRIRNCGTIKNVTFGSHATIQDVIRLEEGSILSNDKATVKIGEGVVAKHFIVQSGSSIDEGALLTHCFVGQAVSIGKQFSAENSAFFCNSEAFHSEACSVFAGPYTVTHHRSTLLIAGLFSFFNAGSGTNQSNHMYKLGPLHQGILDRGAKTGSFSYMLWPSHIGAYTAVIGKHYTNFNISEFPFSYVTEEEGKSVLMPAMNLFTVGTKRDSSKWPKRDKRRDPEKFDMIHFDLFNPFVIGRILKGIETLRRLYENTSREVEFVIHKGVHLKRLILKRAVKYYEMAIKIYMGTEVIRQIDAHPSVHDLEELKVKIEPDKVNLDDWYDWSGMFVSSKSKANLLQALKSNNIKELNDFHQSLITIHKNYFMESWGWCASLIEKQFETPFLKLSKDQFTQIIEDWKVNTIKLNNMIMNDAGKEFDTSSSIGYGLDGSPEDKIKDFITVRGELETNPFIEELQDESRTVELKAEALFKHFGI